MKTFTRELPFKLEATEVAQKAKDLASTELETVELESEIARIKKEAKDEVGGLDSQLKDKRAHTRRLARSVKSGEEYRDVECFERMADPPTEVEIVRADTEEVIECRPATEEDRQLSFDQSVGEVISKVEDDTRAVDEAEDDDGMPDLDDDDDAIPA